MNIDEMIAVLTAAKEGKKIEAQDRQTLAKETWALWTAFPYFDPTRYRYRIAPSPIAAGHNPDKLTEEQIGVSEGWRLLSVEERKAINDNTSANSAHGLTQRWTDNAWSDISAGNSSLYTYRTKQPPGYFLPKPKTKVQLGPEDFPPGTLIRCSKEWPKVPWFLYAITDIGLNVRWPDVRRAHSWMDLTILYLERSLDGGKTWLPCYKEE